MTRRYHQPTWKEQIWIWWPSMPFQWPVNLAGGRYGISSQWSSWCPNGLGPTFYQCRILKLSAKTCYTTWRSQEKVQCLTWCIIYPHTNLEQQWINCRLLSLYLQKYCGFQNISCVRLPPEKSFHPSASVVYGFGYYRDRQIPQNPPPNRCSQPDVPCDLGESEWWTHQLAVHQRHRWCVTQAHQRRGNHKYIPYLTIIYPYPR